MVYSVLIEASIAPFSYPGPGTSGKRAGKERRSHMECNGTGFARRDGIFCVCELTETGTARKNLYKVRPGKTPALGGKGLTISHL